MLSATALQIILIIILMLASAFFSSSETAIMSSSDSKLHALKKEGHKNSEKLLLLRANKERVIGGILLSNTFVNIAASSVSTGLFIEIFGDNPQSLIYSTLLMTVLILIYGEILPKTFAIRNPESLALKITPIFQYVIIILYPFTKFFQGIVNLTLKIFTGNKKYETSLSGLDLIKGAIEMHHEQGSVVYEDKHMLGGLIDLETIDVNEIMIHRNDFNSISIDQKPSKIVDYIIKNKHSRILLWRKTPDNIIGIIHVKDVIHLLRKHESVTNRDIVKILRKPWFVPSTNTLRMQLTAFREQQQHLAIVVDEYGEVLGLITLEDILEEVVGHIEDEHDGASKHKITRNSKNVISAFGDLSIRDLNREMNWDISDENASSIGGLLFHLAQRVPNIGESFKIDGYRIKALKKGHNKITKVRVQKIVARIPNKH